MNQRYRLNILGSEHLSQFFHILGNCVVQLGAEHHENLILQESPVKVGVGKGHTIGGYEEMGIFKIWSVGIEKLKLDRPLA